MFKQGWATLAMGAFWTAANAQQFIVYEGAPVISGTVIQSAPVMQYAPAPFVQYAPAVPAAPCGSCAPTASFVADCHHSQHIPGCDDCVCTSLPFTMVCNGKCRPECHEHDIPVKPGSELPPAPCPNQSFYSWQFPFRCVKKTPHLQICCYETYHFKSWTECKECCDITTCVPCKRVECKTKRCVEYPIEVHFIAKRRTGTGRWDVYAENVPGMPSSFLWLKDATWWQVYNEFKDCNGREIQATEPTAPPAAAPPAAAPPAAAPPAAAPGA